MSAADLSNRKILVVDDNATLLTVVKDILVRHGFCVITADNVRDARSHIDQEKPDIIVCDIMMPNEDGFTFYRCLRENKDLGNIPFIFLTAVAGNEEVRLAKRMGVDDYLTKPFSPEDLVSVVKGKLKRSLENKAFVNHLMDDSRKRVIHTLSHEFRTPLVAVNTGTELLKEQYKKLDENVFVDLLDSVRRGGLRLQHLVEDFITLQQIDSGHAASVSKRFARAVIFGDLVAKAIECFKDDLDPIEKIEIKYSKPAPEDSGAVLVYEAHITNVIGRILSNAKKFGGKGNPIEVAIEKGTQHLAVVIRDHGAGIPQNVIEEACGLFTQINRDIMEQQGCGLGLAIACSYLNLNGGSMHFRQPTEGTGTIVELRFPIAS